ncbi:MAG: hypothetical protein ACN4GF_02150 [Lentimonas sp.]
MATQAYDVIDIKISFAGDVGGLSYSERNGSVGYIYYMGTNEVTDTGYVALLNAKGSQNVNGIFNQDLQDATIHGSIQ